MHAVKFVFHRDNVVTVASIILLAALAIAKFGFGINI